MIEETCRRLTHHPSQFWPGEFKMLATQPTQNTTPYRNFAGWSTFDGVN
jgi:hypothetical protein